MGKNTCKNIQPADNNEEIRYIDDNKQLHTLKHSKMPNRCTRDQDDERISCYTYIALIAF